MRELNREQVIKDLERLVDKYGENGSYNTYCTLSDSCSLIKELADERDRCLEALSELADNIGLLKDKAIADTVRKMQEKILAKSEYGTINISSWQLDQIVKELLEE